MSNPYFFNVSKEAGLTMVNLNKYWLEAKEVALEEYNKSDENFYGHVVNIFKNMIAEKESINNESLLILTVDSFFDYVCEEGEIATTSADIAQPDKMMFGRPVFRVSNDMFHKIGFENRKKFGWRQQFYGTKVGEWCRQNKGKAFTIENEDNDWLMDIERDRHEKYTKEVTIDNEQRKRKTNR